MTALELKTHEDSMLAVFSKGSITDLKPLLT